ncbi:MAG: DUF6473 family protein [Pseudomonadota bacterium]
MVRAARGLNAQELEHCRYDGSKLMLRGPRRDLDGAFVACLGGTETFARFIAEPYPDLLEAALGVTCVNFGWPNAGIDVFRGDPALIDCASRSQVCVLQVPNAINMSNLYYRVHPRRNDRVLEVLSPMRALFPDVDFTQFSFTRHMLTWLRKHHKDEFCYVLKELASVWVVGMTDLLDRIDTPVVLLWMSMRNPEEFADRPDLAADPSLVTRAMLDVLDPYVAGLVEVMITPEARGVEPQAVEASASEAQTILTADAHADTARSLVPTLSDLLELEKARHWGEPS